MVHLDGFIAFITADTLKVIWSGLKVVNIDPESRFLALSSETIDLFFWNFYNSFISEDYEISEPYLEDGGALITKKAAD